MTHIEQDKLIEQAKERFEKSLEPIVYKPVDDTRYYIGLHGDSDCTDYVEKVKNTFLSELRSLERATEERVLRGLLEHAQKEIAPTHFNQHWFKAHIKVYASSLGIDLSEGK